MTAAALDTWYMLGRQSRNLLRQPIWIVFMLMQPMFWLLLYSQLFRRIVDLPGFEGQSYVQFLTPGIVVMTAFFSAAGGATASKKAKPSKRPRAITSLDDGLILRSSTAPKISQEVG